MRILLFTSSKSVINAFSALQRSKNFVVDTHPPDSLRSTLRDASPSTVAYVDISDMDVDPQKKLIKYLSSRETAIGVIDLNSDIDDVAELFRLGFFDYMDKSIIKSGIKTARMKRFIEFSGALDGNDDSEVPQNSDWKLSGQDWKGIRTGQEYTFCFLYIELDLSSEWRRKSGRGLIDDAMETFKDLLTKAMTPYNGKIWMWMDLGGVVLFPFDGKPIGAVRACMRMVMNRVISSAEDYSYDTLITFRMAMHIGNTIYKDRGQTGTIVSDTINFIFHLGQQFAKPGCFYLTDEVIPYVPEALRSCFRTSGSFAERHIHRMRMPTGVGP